MTYLVVTHRDAWKIMYDGRYSTRYSTKAAALEVARELARLDGDADVLVQDDTLRLRMVAVGSNVRRSSEGMGERPQAKKEVQSTDSHSFQDTT